MKKYRRYVKAADEGNADMNMIFGELITEADNLDYELTISGDYKMTLKAKKDKDMMPEITVITDKEKDTYIFTPTMKFPTIDGADVDYADDFEFWTKKWAKVAKFVSHIWEFEYDTNTEYSE